MYGLADHESLLQVARHPLPQPANLGAVVTYVVAADQALVEPSCSPVLRLRAARPVMCGSTTRRELIARINMNKALQVRTPPKLAVCVTQSPRRPSRGGADTAQIGGLCNCSERQREADRGADTAQIGGLCNL